MGYTMMQLRPPSRSRVLALIAEVQVAEGSPPLSEYKTMRLEGGIDVHERVASDVRGAVVGYGQAAWHRGSSDLAGHWAIEVVMAPDHRSPQATGELIESLAEDAVGPAMLWSWSDYVNEAAAVLGWKAQRTLLEMRRPLPIPELDLLLPNIRLTSFRVGVDEAAWLEANNAAFAGHPENGNMTRRDLERRMTQSWFDPEGFFLAWNGGVLVGSCWTKVHEDGSGEIYIIGVIPTWEGKGLGRGLVAIGLDYLATVRHARTAMLYVESTNHRALELYDRLGFERTRTIHGYASPSDISVEG